MVSSQEDADAIEARAKELGSRKSPKPSAWPKYLLFGVSGAILLKLLWDVSSKSYRRARQSDARREFEQIQEGFFARKKAEREAVRARGGLRPAMFEQSRNLNPEQRTAMRRMLKALDAGAEADNARTRRVDLEKTMVSR